MRWGFSSTDQCHWCHRWAVENGKTIQGKSNINKQPWFQWSQLKPDIWRLERWWPLGLVLQNSEITNVRQVTQRQSMELLTFTGFSIRLQGESHRTAAADPCSCILTSPVAAAVVYSAALYKELKREMEEDKWPVHTLSWFSCTTKALCSY